jgi:hypothetical protein
LKSVKQHYDIITVKAKEKPVNQEALARTILCPEFSNPEN